MPMEKHTKRSARSLGGRSTVQRYGPQHMSKIGKKGAAVTWQRYHLMPYGIGDFAMVDEQTGTIKAFLSGISL